MNLRLIFTMVMLCTPLSATAQAQPKILAVSPPEATSRHEFGLMLNVQPLDGGRTLLNDGRQRRLLVLDSSLTVVSVLLDSAIADGAGYGPRASPLIPYLGDSSLFVDGQSLSLLVVSSSGRIVRTIAPPHTSIMRPLSASMSGTDRNGNLVFRGLVYADDRPLGQGNTIVSTTPDSAEIIRADFSNRKVDTIARVKLSNGLRTEISRDAALNVSTKRIINPVAQVDEWAVLSDGSIALVRGHDYHIDWIRGDGTRTSSPRLPFDWKRLTDDDKRALIDSARAAEDSAIAALNAAAARARTSGEVSGEGRRVTMLPPIISFVPIEAMGDYQPAIRPGAVRADLDNNLWILPSTSSRSLAGELVYDVVNSSGELTHRVRLPADRSIVGFGHGGVLYLANRKGNTWSLERRRVVTDVSSK